MQGGHFAQDGDRGVVVHIVAIGGQQAVMAVAGVRIEGDVGEENQLGHRCLDRPDRPQHEAVGIQRLAAIGGLEHGGGHGEQRDTPNAQREELPCLPHQVIEIEPEDPGHGPHGRRRGDTLLDEQGCDEVRRMEPDLLHHLTDGRTAPQPPGPKGRKPR